MNGAYAGFEEKDKGSLEVGKLADFLVVDRDVLTVPSDQLKDVHVLETYVGGKLLYQENSARQASEWIVGDRDANARAYFAK